MGNRFTGGDIGEQDARFANIFETCYDRFSQTDRFQNFKVASRFQGQVADDLGNISSLLTNLWLWHYPVKDGNVMISGVQTQPKHGIANSQVQYSFLRGAGKQYGVPWWGNVSIFSTDWFNNGVNYKSYPYAPNTGNSISLMRRLLFSHYLYGCRILSFEGEQRAWNGDNSVTPIGKIQEAMVQTINQYGKAGVMHTPVALLQDFWSGWMPAQHNRGNYYTWNAMDYDQGDFFTHDVYSLLYPKYEENGFFQNESGGMCDTPFGDMADTLLTDVSSPILKRYGLVIATSHMRSADTELRDKVTSFISNGGNFVVTAENARRLWPEFGIGETQIDLSPGGTVNWADSSTTTEGHAGVLYSINTGALPSGHTVLATYAGNPAVIDVPIGSGKLTLLMSPLGVNKYPLTSLHPGTGYNTTLPKPYVMMNHVQKLVSDRLSAQRLFSVGNPNLGYITCRKGPGEYLVGILNNSLNSQPFSISSHIGTITHLTELDLGTSVKNDPGFWPTGYESNNGGISDGSNVSGGDIRLFRVEVAESGSLRTLAPTVPPTRPSKRMVAVPSLADLKDTIQKWPTFFEHFSGVKVDGVADVTLGAGPELYEPFQWLVRQQVEIVADFTNDLVSGDLTLRSDATGYAQSMATFGSSLDNLALLVRAKDIIITAEEVAAEQLEAYRTGVAALCSQAASHGMTVHFKHRPTSWTPNPASTLSFISSVSAANLHLAASTADGSAGMGGSNGLILIEPPAAGSPDLSALSSNNGIQILNAAYDSWDAVYKDIRTAWGGGGTTLVGTTLSPPQESLWQTAAANANRYWFARGTTDMPDTLRKMPEFWLHFGGVKVDYKYLAHRDAAQCARDGQWLAARNVKVIVDFTEDLNNYPGLRFTDSPTPNDGVSAAYDRSQATFTEVFEKMQLIGSKQCIIRPTEGVTSTSPYAYRDFCANAWAHGQIMVYMQPVVGNWITRNDQSYHTAGYVAWMVDVIAPANGNLRMAVNGCHDANLAGAVATAGGRLGMILLGYPGASRADVDSHGPARWGMSLGAISGQNVPLILDADYADWNDTAADLAYLGWNAVAPPGPPFAPQNFFANPGNQQVTLGWDPATGASNYTVKRSTMRGGPYVTVATLGGTSFTDTGVTNGTTYYYVVSASNAHGEGNNSAEAGATPGADDGWSLTWSGEINNSWDSATSNWKLNNTPTVFSKVRNLLFDDSAAGNTGINLVSAFEPLSVLVNNSSKNYTFSGSAIAGPTGLSKSGSGSLTLQNFNTYTGGTTVYAGNLVLSSSSYDQAVIRGSLTVNSGGTVTIAGADYTGFGRINGSTVGTLNVNGGTVQNTIQSFLTGATVNLTGGTMAGGTYHVISSSLNSKASATTSTVSSNLTVRKDYGSGDLNIDVEDGTAATDLRISGYLGQTATTSLTKTGAGTLEIAGTSGLTGHTTIHAGKLRIANGASLYNSGWNGSTSLTVNSGATLELNRWGYGPGGANLSLGGLDYNPARFLINGGTVRCTGGAAAAPTDPNEAPYGPGFTIGALGATLDAAKANDTWTVKHDSRGYGPITSNAGGTLTLTGSGNGIFDKELGGSGGVTKSGTGTWSLARPNSYTGPTNVAAGTLSLGNGASNTNLADSAAVIVAGGGTLHLNYNGTDTVNALTFAGIARPPGLYSAANSPFITGPGTLTVSTGPATDYAGWAAFHTVTGGQNGDDDHDGLTNMDEYAFGLDPKNGAAVNPIAVPFDKTTGTFTYTRRSSSLTLLTYSVWYSTNLRTWTKDTGATEGIPIVNGDLETVPVTLSSGLLSNSKLFIQVRAE
jgi:autotransporter-associated beta strand protein